MMATNGAAKPKPRPTLAAKHLQAVDQHVKTLEEKVDDVLSRQEEQNIKFDQHSKDMLKVLRLLGEETEDGDGGIHATGILGRLRRGEVALHQLRTSFRVWAAYGMGFVCCAAIAITGFWWLVGDKLAIVLKAH